jgi:hypothetical protein
MEAVTTFVSSRGLLKSCANRNFNPISSSEIINDNIIDKFEAYDSIYICADALENFSNNVLNRIEHPFVLVSGDSDRKIDEKLISQEVISRIVNHKNLINWHAQNLVFEHVKLKQLPIGLDYHTMWEHPGIWGLAKQSPIAQEHTLISTLSNSYDLEKRYFACYCNWHFAIERGDREDCYNKIDKSTCLIEPNKLPRISTWKRQADCVFVISPEGAGIDCHRTWEALLLGCIPVIKKSNFSKIFNNLPVVIVEDWEEVNQKNLLNHYQKLNERKYDFSKLFLKYWKNEINNQEVFKMPDMTIKEFKNILTQKSN